MESGIRRERDRERERERERGRERSRSPAARRRRLDVPDATTSPRPLSHVAERSGSTDETSFYTPVHSPDVIEAALPSSVLLPSPAPAREQPRHSPSAPQLAPTQSGHGPSATLRPPPLQHTHSSQSVRPSLAHSASYETAHSSFSPAVPNPHSPDYPNQAGAPPTFAAATAAAAPTAARHTFSLSL